MNGHGSSRRPQPSASGFLRQEIRLIEQARQGNKQAIGELYHRHVDLVYRYVYVRVGNETVAEDLTAQVFLKALEGLPGYQPGDRPFVAWLYRIAYARTVDYWRQQRSRQEVPLPDSLPAEGPQPEEMMDAEAEWMTAIDLLAQLTDDQQEVIILRFIGEMSLSEVAETLGKTVSAVKATQHRALASLARLLEKRTAGDQDE